jgi:hypothetical protein
VLQFDNTTNMELLFYTGTAGQYRIRSLTIDDCTGVCHGAADLKQQVLSDTPGLSDALAAGDTWNAGKMILHWAAPRVDWAQDSRSLFDTSGIDAPQLFYDYFQPGNGGVYCGGAADFLRRTLALFGITGYRFDFGTASGDLTHAVVILPFPNSSGGIDYRILDPTFNMDYTVTTSGKPATAYALWELWRAGYTDKIQTNQQSLASRAVLTSPLSGGGFNSVRCSSLTNFNGCGFAEYLSEFQSTYQRDGFQAGLAGFIQLMGTTEVTDVTPNDTPAGFVSTHDTFKDAVLNNKSDVHVTYLPLPPTNSAPPQISGDPSVGSTLTASTGQWSSPTTIDGYAYSWSVCDQDGTNCQAVPGATASTYQPADSDQARLVKVAVTAHNTDGTSDPTSSAPVGPIGPRAVPKAGTPTVAGTPIAGRTLTANPGTWQGSSPIFFSYQWITCAGDGSGCSDISGATLDHYDTTSSDIGHTLAVRVTGTNPYGSDTATSQPTTAIQGAPPKNQVPPGIVGTTQDGQRVTITSTEWDGSFPLAYSYQWMRCDQGGANCTSIDRAINEAYRFTSADVAHTVRVQMTATNSYGSDTVTSQPSAVVSGAPPVNTSPPGLSGAPVTGQTLDYTSSQWSGTQPFTYSTQWIRCDSNGANCQNIAGATGDRYTLTSSDLGNRVKLRLTAANQWGSGSADTPLSLVVGNAPQNVTAPSLTGTPQDGQALLSGGSQWSGTGPFTYSYQWVRCDSNGANCSNIATATNDRYRLTAADVGNRVKMHMTGTTPYGAASADTPLTAVVAGAPPANVTPPALSGTAQDGQVIASGSSQWSGTGPFTYSYQWLRCDANAANCQNIANATGDRYRLTSAEIGSRVKTRLTATTPYGSASVDTQPTGVVVGAPPQNTVAPTIGGTASPGQVMQITAKGTWSGTSPLTWTFQWYRCNSSGSSCAAISGATSLSYKLTGSDKNSTVKARVTATNPYGSAWADSSVSALVQ